MNDSVKLSARACELLTSTKITTKSCMNFIRDKICFLVAIFAYLVFIFE